MSEDSAPEPASADSTPEAHSAPSSSDTTPDASRDPSSEEAWIGRQIGGRFRLTEELGSGGIAFVFRAQDEELSRSVAVKILQDSGHGRPELRARFEREAKVLAALSHPHIVSLVDFGVEGDRAYLVMELLRGITLGELLDEQGRLPPERSIHILRQATRALIYAHREGLLHRDLKPDNVFLQSLPDTPDHVRLLDFGFAKFVGDANNDGPPLTQVGTVFGTPRYMAPEQLTGVSVDARADIYALGVIFYEMVSGRRPFEGEVRDVLKAKVISDPPTLASIAPELWIAPELEAFFAKALATRREDRFAGAQEFLEALEALPTPPLRPRDSAPPADSKPAAKARSSLPITLPKNLKDLKNLPLPLLGAAAGALVVFGLVVTLIVWIAWPDDPPAPPPPVAVQTPEPPPEPASDAITLPVPDPWLSVGHLPYVMRSARDALDRGEPVSNVAYRELREYAFTHEDNAYAQLLLGHVYVERGMRAMAAGSYQKAARADPGARGDPRMIVNLVRMASEAHVGPAPARVLREVYGAEAIPVIDSALARPGLDAAAARRLQTLRDQLAARQ